MQGYWKRPEADAETFVEIDNCKWMRTGDLVPSVRELARELAVNPNTVARAYQQLQADAVLAPVRGTGLAVAEGAPQRCREQRMLLIGDRLRQVLAEAAQSGLTPAKIRSLIDAELSAGQV